MALRLAPSWTPPLEAAIDGSWDPENLIRIFADCDRCASAVKSRSAVRHVAKCRPDSDPGFGRRPLWAFLSP
jgi:hypothetical protein